MIKFIVPGRPKGKARPRFTRSGLTYTDAKTVKYEESVAMMYAATHAKKLEKGTPIRVEITAIYYIRKDESVLRHNLMAQGTVRPTKKPDLDNVVKIILDALNGVAWDDDSQIVEIVAKKQYGDEPCVIVEIEKLPSAIDIIRGGARG